MLIKGEISTDRTNFLVHKYNELVNSGVKKENILVLTLNSYKKLLFLNQIKDGKVLTFQGLCYNAFLDNKDYISNLINDSNPEKKPNLCGLEISQFIFKQSIKEADFSDYISKVNLLHQLFRRYSLIVQNGLSNEEVNKRSRILNESFYKDAQKAIDDYKLKTIQYKSFDYLRQMAILPLIYKNTDYFKNIEYLFVDDADEFSYAFWQFIDAVMPNLKDYFIAYDENGSSRAGYLCAYKSGVEKFKKNYSPIEKELSCNSFFKKEAKTFYANLKQGTKTKFDLIKSHSSVRRLDMIENIISETKNLLNSGVKENEIAIITPVVDDIFKQSLLDTDINFQIISGNEKLADINFIKHILIILKIVNNIGIKDYEIKNVLINLLNIPFKKCYKVVKNGNIFECDIKNDKYTKLVNIIKSLQTRKYGISEQIKIIFDNVIRVNLSNFDIRKYDFLLKEAIGFETAFSSKIDNVAEQFIIQIENSVISENPAETIAIKQNSIIVGTPQKIIDYSISTKYQLWLDVSNNEWLKEDTGTLYNAWVFNRDWNKDEYNLEDNVELSRDKTARIVRKLMLLSQKEIKFYSSLYDNVGNENYGGLSDYIETVKDENKKTIFKIVPRLDQKPVLDYKRGKMGIMAVPGAGKTTILLALITQLIQDGTKPENIFVLTYMESAAKNFKERIQAALPDNIDVPNISTIHGLALRIIKENANYTKVGLDSNFEICDDTQKEKIIKSILIDEEKFDNYLRCLSIVKLSGVEKLYSKHREIQDFFSFYREYNNMLKQNNLIDYDDMLYYAVKILKDNKDVLKYYQNLCEYIIEDEAQDSSEIQQKLINLLSGKHKNLVRCGDINQAITTTFTNSDTQGFRSYLDESKKVEMNSSQRCSEPIFSLANKLVKECANNEPYKSAFYEIKMIGTGKNPNNSEKPSFTYVDNEKEEKVFILNKIREIQKNSPKSSIAILLRLNAYVNEYNEFFLSNGIKTAIRTDCLAQKKIFQKILAVLKVIQMPLNNKFILNLANNSEDSDFIEKLKEPFIDLNPDNIFSESLLQLYWDIDYWLNQSTASIDDIALKVGLYYSTTSVDKANTYLVSNFIKKLNTKNSSYDEVIKQLEYASSRPLSAYKFFEDEVFQQENSINIMTMHKSKGDEFDYVFIPQMNEEIYPLEKDNVKIKNGGHFVQTIKALIEEKQIKTPDIIKKEIIDETLRLLYVGITRAKLQLFFSSAKETKKRKPVKQCRLMEKIIVE